MLYRSATASRVIELDGDDVCVIGQQSYPEGTHNAAPRGRVALTIPSTRFITFGGEVMRPVLVTLADRLSLMVVDTPGAR